MNFNKTAIFEKLYPGEKYNDKKLRDGFSALLKLAEEYLSYSEYKKNSYLFKKNILVAFEKKQLESLFEKNLQFLENEICKNDGLLTDYFLSISELKDLKADHLIKGNHEEKAANITIEKSEYLILYFLAKIIKTFQDLVVNQGNFNIDYGKSLADEFFKCLNLEMVLKFLQDREHKYYPYFALNYYYLKFIKDYEDDINFFNFKKLFNLHADEFNSYEKLVFYRCMESCLILKGGFSNSVFFRLLYDHYREMINKKIYSFDSEKYFNMNLFRNIVIIGCSVEELHWVEEFINRYIDLIVPEHRDNMLYLSKGFLEFKRKNYELTLEILSKIKLEFFHFKLDVKILMLKCYYELNYTEPLLSLIDASRHFFSKNNLLTGSYRDSYLNFLKYLNSIVKMKSGHDFSHIEILKNQIFSEKYISNKDWLFKKVNELQEYSTIS